MDALPDEVLDEVFLHLRPSERLRCSLICRRWANLLTSRRLLGGARLVLIRDPDLPAVMNVLSNNGRRYSHMLIRGGELQEFDRSFWARIGKSLTELEVYSCQVPYSVLCEILGACNQLQSLHLKAFPVSEFFDELANAPAENIAAVEQSLAAIKRVYFWDNGDLTDALFRAIIQLMPNVVALTLESSDKSRPIALPSFFTEAKDRFVELNLQVPGEPEGIAMVMDSSQNSLEMISLAYCIHVEQNVCRSLALCTNVTVLAMRASKVEDLELEAILSCTRKLEELDLSFCERIGNCGCQAIGRLQHLKGLKLKACSRISSTGLCDLQSLKELRCLDLSSTKSNLKTIRALKTLTKLTVLRLDNCAKICNACVRIICDNLKKLERLDLSWCRKITDDGCSQLHKLNVLRDLSLAAVPLLTNRALEMGVTVPTLVRTTSRYQPLEVLNLKYGQNITDIGIIALVERLPHLRELIVGGCKQLTDQSLEAIEKHSLRLEKLSISPRPFSEEALTRFGRLSPNVVVNRIC